MNEIEILTKKILHESPQKGDAIIWLQGDGYERGEKVLELFRDGYGHYIVITGNDIRIEEKQRLGQNNIRIQEMQEWLMRNGVSGNQIIVDPLAMHTRVLSRGKRGNLHCR